MSRSTKWRTIIRFESISEDGAIAVVPSWAAMKRILIKADSLPLWVTCLIKRTQKPCRMYCLAALGAVSERALHISDYESSAPWGLRGVDTFADETYEIEGNYESELAATAAGHRQLDDINRLQPKATSGGQDGIQDRIFIVGPGTHNPAETRLFRLA